MLVMRDCNLLLRCGEVLRREVYAVWKYKGEIKGAQILGANLPG
jgi:hypothetical protein